jgi:thiol-disulfide isomerase/thioredoxin
METLISAMIAAGPPAKRPPQSWFAPAWDGLALEDGLEDGSEEEADMRTLSAKTWAFVLLVAVVVAATAFYRMVVLEGEGKAEDRQVILVTPPSTAESLQQAEKLAAQRPGPDWAQALDRLDPPVPATTVPFQLGDDTPLTLADFKGKGVVLNLWATWCAPCVREMPSLERLQAAVAADGIEVVAVSSDRGGAALVEVFMATHKLTNLKHYLDPHGAFTRSIEGRGLPRTYIINAKGEIAANFIGPAEWDAPDLVAAVRELAR